MAYGYDLLQRMTTAGENGAVSGIGLLATYTYDDLGDTTAITRGNGANTALGYDGADRLSSLAHSFTNTAANVSWSFGYDTANGVLSRTATNDSYTYHPGALSLGYIANGLNQYSSVSSTSYTYDARGNLTSDGTRAFTYDVDNRLLTGSAPTAVTLTYDPTGRLQTSTAASATTTMLDDGPNLAGEYNSSGMLLRRYVPGRGVDQPVIWYEGSGTTDRRWLHTDNQDSVVAYSDGSGNEAAMYGYSPYGEPASWAGPRYGYTGQTMIPEAQLFYYKARVYDPKFGRFLQTDPIGYLADMNMFAYVKNGPTNAGDSLGLESTDTCNHDSVLSNCGVEREGPYGSSSTFDATGTPVAEVVVEGKGKSGPGGGCDACSTDEDIENQLNALTHGFDVDEGAFSSGFVRNNLLHTLNPPQKCPLGLPATVSTGIVFSGATVAVAGPIETGHALALASELRAATLAAEVTAGIEGGAEIGAGAGTEGGPPGMVVGAGVGAAVGAIAATMWWVATYQVPGCIH